MMGSDRYHDFPRVRAPESNRYRALREALCDVLGLKARATDEQILAMVKAMRDDVEAGTDMEGP